MVAPPALSFAGTAPDDVGVDPEIEVNPLTGSAIVRVPLALTPGRADFGPQLVLEYDSSAGNSPYGLGWSLQGLLTIAVNTRESLPRYDPRDSFVFTRTGELVPVLRKQGGQRRPRVEESGDFWVRCFRGRVETGHVRVEQWIHKTTNRVHWRTRDVRNVVTIYGLDPTDRSRIADPADPARTFAWLPEAQYDARGNAIQYDYAAETLAGVDGSLPQERSRVVGTTGLAQRYLKRIRYGNTKPLDADVPIPADNTWLFEVVLDYGDHADAGLPTPVTDREVAIRPDPFSTFRPGFEVRTYRLCRRVLLFHRFDQLGPEPVLVGAHRFEYDLRPEGSTLRGVQYTGFRRDPASGQIDQRAVPPLHFTYSAPAVARAFEPVAAEAIENVPHGLGGPGYRWIDLYGEGLSGILLETRDAWYFKPNEGGGRFGPKQLVVEKPAHALRLCALTDFDSDGNPNLAVLHGRHGGFYEYDRDTGSWLGFRPFPALPHLEAAGARAQWLDLDGDGRADLLLPDPERLTWYPALGKDGFGPAIEIQRPASSTATTAPLGEDPALDFFFADMNGDGLVDQVRVVNGRVEYWPQLGHGRFGDPILMANSPRFAADGEFDAARVLLVDLDGNGTADIVYVGAGEARYWINAAGNGLIDGGRIATLPYIDNVSTLRVVDFLGDGTPCLVWSSPLPDRATPVQYLPLTSGVKPRLLLSADNAMGREVRLIYSTSATHYLRDKHAGRPWRTRLPRHPVVVDRMEIIDQIGGARSVTRHEYHEGFFDGPEQAFRGFGMVDQYDCEHHDGPAGMPEEAYTTPACLRTWFHMGHPLSDALVDQHRDPGLAPIPVHTLENLAELKPGEYEDGLRALAGAVIRQELFAIGPDGQRGPHPIQLTRHAYRVRRLQPAQGGNAASFTFFASERVTCAYEQEPDDPRVTHELTLEIDDFGHVLVDGSISCARRPSAPAASAAQQRPSIAIRRHRYASVDTLERYETGIPVEEQAFEISGLAPGSANAFEWTQVRQQLAPALTAPLPYHADFASSGLQARLIGWERTFYWNDAATAPLPLGLMGRRTLLHHQESACFTPELVSQVYGTRVHDALLQGDGGYQQREGYWWKSGATTSFRPASGFFQLARVEQPDGGITAFTHDAAALVVVQMDDALGNRTRAEIDYHLLAPSRITDPNDNVAEVIYDPLGIATVSTAHGHVLDAQDTPQPYGHDRLATYVPRSDASFGTVLANPHRYLQTAATFLYYELDTWQRLGQPPHSLALVREELVKDGAGGGVPAGPIQIGVSYFDGFRRILQRKTLVEPGPALQRDGQGRLILDDSGRPVEGLAAERWLVGGHTVYNHKQNPVRQYEPFHSVTPAYEPEAVLAQFGVSQQFHYDAADRLIRQDLPVGTSMRTEFRPWEIRRFDANDTVLGSPYQARRQGLPDGHPEKRALREAESHADTPTIVHLDPRGKAVKQVDVAADGNNRVTETILDINGDATVLLDPRGLTACRYRLDMLGRVLFMQSIDAGETWTLPDIQDQPAHVWISRGVHQHRRFDLLGRPMSVVVDGALGLTQRTEQLIYGEDPSVAQAALRNARGRLVVHRDQAGVLTVQQYDLAGQPLRTARQLRQDYKTEPDWTSPAAVALEPTRHVTATTFDALGRIRRQTLPDGTRRQLDYLRSGGLDRVMLSTTDGTLTDVVLFDGSSFNARGQRSRARLGNGVEITHQFDRETFRTNRITSRRLDGAIGGSAPLQDIAYTYDPAGNLTHTVDHAQEPAGVGPFLQGLNVSSESEFTYDSFYQLVRATGRVHQALLEHDHRPDQPTPGVIKGTRHLSLNNGAAVERYTRTYDYDLAGNVRRIRHQGITRQWNTEVWISPASNRALPALHPDGQPVTGPEARFDASGNWTSPPYLRRLDWNYRNNIARAVLIDRTGTGQPDDAEYYVYDGSGQRVRRITEKLAGGQVEITEKIYLDGCEIKRIRRGPELRLERLTSHVSDGVNRVALVHRWTVDTGARETDDTTRPRIRYQLSNHLGSAQLELDEQGAVISYEEYFPYGGSAFIAGDRTREIEIREYRFAGKERDDATGLVYFGYRYYAPWIGRWMSPDPIGPEDDLNLYRYVFNNPVNLVDPDGLQASQPTAEAPPVRYVPIPFGELLRRLPKEADIAKVRKDSPYLIAVTPKGTEPWKERTTEAELIALVQKYNETNTDGFIGVYSPEYQAEYEPRSKEADYQQLLEIGYSEEDAKRLAEQEGLEDAPGETDHDVPEEGGIEQPSEVGADRGPSDGPPRRGEPKAEGTPDGRGRGEGRKRGRRPSRPKGKAGGKGGGGGGEGAGGPGGIPEGVVGEIVGGTVGGLVGGVVGAVVGGALGGILGAEGERGGRAGGAGDRGGGGGTQPPPPGQTTNGNPRDAREGAREPGSGNGTGSTGSGLTPGTPSASPHGASKDGQGTPPPAQEQRTIFDPIIKYVGWANLEFGGGDGPGRSGGVPGGQGSHASAGGQALYIALTVLSFLVPMKWLGPVFKALGSGLSKLAAPILRGLGTALGGLTRAVAKWLWDPFYLRRLLIKWATKTKSYIPTVMKALGEYKPRTRDILISTEHIAQGGLPLLKTVAHEAGHKLQHTIAEAFGMTAQKFLDRYAKKSFFTAGLELTTEWFASGSLKTALRLLVYARKPYLEGAAFKVAAVALGFVEGLYWTTFTMGAMGTGAAGVYLYMTQE